MDLLKERKVQIALGVAAAAAIAVALLAGSCGEPKAASTKQSVPRNPDDLTKEDIKDTIRAIINQQQKMVSAVVEVKKELLRTPVSKVTLDFVYDRVSSLKHDPDPIESAGLNFEQFDHLLTKYETHRDVRELVLQMMRVQDNDPIDDAKVMQLTVQQVIEMHRCMEDSVQSIVRDVSARTPEQRAKLNHKDLALAAQCFASCAVERQFDVTSTELEAAVARHHSTLICSQQFTSHNVNMQAALTALLEV